MRFSSTTTRKFVILSGGFCRGGPMQLAGECIGPPLRFASDQDDRFDFASADVHLSLTLTVRICHPASRGLRRCAILRHISSTL